MIEVEKKFQPTDEQLKAMLEGAEFLGEVVNHDVYYDYPDFRYYTNAENTCLRKRNGSFELKMHTGKGFSKEVENLDEIAEHFGVDDLLSFVNEKMVPIIEYKTERRKYKKGEFTIDVDKTDFGTGEKYLMCEIECMVENDAEVAETLEKIMNLAKQHNFETKKIFSKHKEYLRRVKPEVYEKLFNNNGPK